MHEKFLGKVIHSSSYTAVFTADRLTKLYSSNEKNVLYWRNWNAMKEKNTSNISDSENNSFVICNQNVICDDRVLTRHVVFILCFIDENATESAITSKLQHSTSFHESEPAKPTDVLLP